MDGLIAAARELSGRNGSMTDLAHRLLAFAIVGGRWDGALLVIARLALKALSLFVTTCRFGSPDSRASLS